jgi:hypothetical protein
MTTRFLLACALLCAPIGSAQTSSPNKALTEAQIASLKLPVVIDERSAWCIPTAKVPVPDSAVPSLCKQFRPNSTSQCQQKLEFACTCFKTVAPVGAGGYPIVGCSEVLVVDGRAEEDAHRLANESEVQALTQPRVSPWTGKMMSPSPLKRQPIPVPCRKDGIKTGEFKSIGQDDSHCKAPAIQQGPLSPFG